MTRNVWYYLIAMATAFALVHAFVGGSYADQTVAFHLPPQQCAPCRAMLPIEDKLISAGYRLNRVDATTNPQLARAYRVTRFPTFVHIVERADGRCYETGRIVGACSEGQLRRLAVIPVITTAGAWARNAVRSLFCNPILEW